MTLAAVFRRFDWELYDTRREDVEPARDFFVPVPEPGGNGLRVLVKSAEVIHDIPDIPESHQIDRNTAGFEGHESVISKNT